MFSMLQDVVTVLTRQSWQLVLVFVVVLLICRLARRASAHWRYLLWLLVLAKCLVPPVVTVPLGLWPDASAGNAPARITQETAAPAARPEPPPVADLSAVAQQMAPAAGQSVAGQGQPAYRPLPSPTAAPAVGLADRVAVTFRTWPGPVWLVGVLTYFFAALVKSRRLHRRLLAVRQPVDGDLLAEVESIARRMGLRCCPRVFVADGFSQPFVWGLFRGSVYLPSNFAATAAEHRQAVLGHELAHITRYDAAVNIVQVIVQGIFFHPLIWWANRQVRREREKCCDEIAIAALSTEPRSYSQALVDTLINARGQAVPALAVAGPVRNLEERIRDIMRPSRTFQVRPKRSGLALLGVLGCFALATGLTVTSPTQAQTTKPAATASRPASQPSDSLEALKAKASAGDARSQDTLGFMYGSGKGAAQDDQEAVQWFRKAAEQGDAYAQSTLGFMYRTGRGVPQDDKEAVQWFRKAADQGNAYGQLCLGLAYREGVGVLQNYTAAVQWYRKAAEQGYAPAQFGLGEMYEQGLAAR